MELKHNSTMRVYLYFRSFNCTLWNWNKVFLIASAIRTTFNCTLWNWNDGTEDVSVPCGSTFNCTLWNWNNAPAWFSHVCVCLLIVPYGIETRFDNRCNNFNIILLIVPYGIETRVGLRSVRLRETFNCTLWNWNNIRQIIGAICL